MKFKIMYNLDKCYNNILKQRLFHKISDEVYASMAMKTYKSSTYSAFEVWVRPKLDLSSRFSVKQ